MNFQLDNHRDLINQHYLANESQMIKQLLAGLGDYKADNIQRQARILVSEIRNNKQQTLIDAFLHEYNLNCDEGRVLMGLAEALLRIPDVFTQDLFLQEKLNEADWHKHLNHSDSLLVNFATQALEITANLKNTTHLADNARQQIFSILYSRMGLPLIRRAVKQMMQQLAYQFVIADSINQALAKTTHKAGDSLYSFDMLGESALTKQDAADYFSAYAEAINQLGKYAVHTDIYQNNGISIKLSALYPRYEALQHRLAIPTISQQLLKLCQQARLANITVTVDAEESQRLQMSLHIFNRVITDDSLQGWHGLGLAVQAYQKRAISTLHWLLALAQVLQHKIAVRLVKGAYWDSEIKHAQVDGLSNYPLFTHKAATDVSYLACADFMLSNPLYFYPQFASHNAHTVVAIQAMARQTNQHSYEFQRLHGMAAPLYQQLNAKQAMPCRIYAPVGSYQNLLPYLIRRLLENGANTSFINQLENTDIAIETIIADPVVCLKNLQKTATPDSFYTLPKDLFAQQRVNSDGINLADMHIQSQVQQALKLLTKRLWLATPLIDGISTTGKKQSIINPADADNCVGYVIFADNDVAEKALTSATLAFKTWRLLAVTKRAQMLCNAADLLEKNRFELLSLCVREGGKTIRDALAEIREAVDFCRYYAQQAITHFASPADLLGTTGEKNQLQQYGRGVFVCISPWNFPVAIFIGQIVAALVSGNTVIAKPATQTSLTAMRCIQLLHQAGIPTNVLHFITGDGATIGQYLLADDRINGVAFTGSSLTAHTINQQLAKHPTIIPLIAETGGQNVMIADNSAYHEQLIQDAVQSAFNSAGQRCSALRVLCLPHEIADIIIARIIQMTQLLIIDNPESIATDIGPLISKNAVGQLNDHIKFMQKKAKKIWQMPLAKHLKNTLFYPPTVIELSALSELTGECFGPVLHIIRYHSSQLETLINDINRSGYGLTLGIHSRINSTIKQIVDNTKVGNIYINRNMISAVVGIQPFGGMGLSGTGPKAGGPHYLQRFAIEQTVTTNTAAIGGDIGLLAPR